MKAYCYFSGHIGFGDSLPAGTLPIIEGDRHEIQNLIEDTARLGPDGKTYFVPGVTESSGSGDGVDALIAYSRLLAERRKAQG